VGGVGPLRFAGAPEVISRSHAGDLNIVGVSVATSATPPAGIHELMYMCSLRRFVHIMVVDQPVGQAQTLDHLIAAACR